MLTPLPAAIRTPHQLTRKPTITTGNRVPQRDDLWCLPEVLRLRAINALNPNAQVIFCNSGDCPSILGGSFTTTGK